MADQANKVLDEATPETENARGQRGGKRTNAGRKPLKNKKLRTLVLSAKQLQRFKDLGGSRWLRTTIESLSEAEVAQIEDQRKRFGKKNIHVSPNDKKVTSINLVTDIIPRLERLGGSSWIRGAIDAAFMKTSQKRFFTRAPNYVYPPQSALVDTNAEKMELPLADSTVRAGFPSPAESYIRDVVDLNEMLVSEPAATFYVRAIGDSMDKAGIDDGDLLIVDRSRNPVHNDIVIMRVNDEFTVKRLFKKNDTVKLIPESTNPDYEIISPEENDEWQFIGKVTFVIKQC